MQIREQPAALGWRTLIFPGRNYGNINRIVNVLYQHMKPDLKFDEAGKCAICDDDASPEHFGPLLRQQEYGEEEKVFNRGGYCKLHFEEVLAYNKRAMKEYLIKNNLPLPPSWQEG